MGEVSWLAEWIAEGEQARPYVEKVAAEAEARWKQRIADDKREDRDLPELRRRWENSQQGLRERQLEWLARARATRSANLAKRQ